VVERRPAVDLVSGHVSGHESGDYDNATVTTLPVDSQRIVSGRWVRPWEVGFGVCMVVRRDAVTRLGGWDERLGAGVPDFPAAEDMDFNYRLTRSGGAALHAPSLRVVHDQWRPREQLPALYYGYSKGWAGFAIKHLRTGDARGGLLLWGARVKGILKSFRNAAAMRSRLRLRIAWWEARGLANGTLRALGRRW
jgi:GT2 family glycosyltransferase